METVSIKLPSIEWNRRFNNVRSNRKQFFVKKLILKSRSKLYSTRCLLFGRWKTLNGATASNLIELISSSVWNIYKSRRNEIKLYIKKNDNEISSKYFRSLHTKSIVKAKTFSYSEMQLHCRTELIFLFHLGAESETKRNDMESLQEIKRHPTCWITNWWGRPNLAASRSKSPLISWKTKRAAEEDEEQELVFLWSEGRFTYKKKHLWASIVP